MFSKNLSLSFTGLHLLTDLHAQTVTLTTQINDHIKFKPEQVRNIQPNRRERANSLPPL